MFEKLSDSARQVERGIAANDLPATLEAVADYCREGAAVLRRLRDRIRGPMARAEGGSEERVLAECRAIVGRIRATVGTAAGASAPWAPGVGSSGESGFGLGDRAAIAEMVGAVLELVERFRNK
jgi:hypothetical protein